MGGSALSALPRRSSCVGPSYGSIIGALTGLPLAVGAIIGGYVTRLEMRSVDVFLNAGAAILREAGIRGFRGYCPCPQLCRTIQSECIFGLAHDCCPAGIQLLNVCCFSSRAPQHLVPVPFPFDRVVVIQYVCPAQNDVRRFRNGNDIVRSDRPGTIDRPRDLAQLPLASAAECSCGTIAINVCRIRECRSQGHSLTPGACLQCIGLFCVFSGHLPIDYLSDNSDISPSGLPVGDDMGLLPNHRGSATDHVKWPSGLPNLHPNGLNHSDRIRPHDCPDCKNLPQYGLPRRHNWSMFSRCSQHLAAAIRQICPFEGPKPISVHSIIPVQPARQKNVKPFHIYPITFHVARLITIELMRSTVPMHLRTPYAFKRMLCQRIHNNHIKTGYDFEGPFMQYHDLPDAIPIPPTRQYLTMRDTLQPHLIPHLISLIAFFL